jgi:hypothetical protein
MRTSIAFRVNDAQAILLESLRATFPEPSWRPIFEWLLSQPEVVSVIHRRLAGEQRAVSLDDGHPQGAVALDAPVAGERVEGVDLVDV